MKIVMAVDENPQFRLMARVMIRSLRRHHPDLPITVLDSGAATERSLRDEGCAVIEGRPGFDEALGSIDSSATYFRLDIPERFPDEEFVLYLDVDMVCVGSLERILGERPELLGMVDEKTGPWAGSRVLLDYLGDRRHLLYTVGGSTFFVPLSRASKTYNAGLMLINAARWREESISPRIRRLIEENKAAMAYSDQTAINIFFGYYPHLTGIEELRAAEARLGPLQKTLTSRAWSALGLYATPPCGVSEMPAVFNATPAVQGVDTARIIHFRGPKPWELGGERWKDMKGPAFVRARDVWLSYLGGSDERSQFDAWQAEFASSEGSWP